MPNWSPNWNNVVWNRAAADEAASALRRAADRLDITASERSRVAQDATAEWRGKHRETFDGHLTQILGRARDLAGEFRGAASRICAASDRAREEQNRRERDRERWYRERDEEERAKQRRR
jgi:hypothetical protein